MTQILAALTPEYVVVASDRRLVFPNHTIADDDSCKLISLCGAWGIAYTGLAQLQRKPTHEWIAVRLAENGCRGAHAAGQVLVAAAGAAFQSVPFVTELTILIAGWTTSTDQKTLQPHFLLISNMYDSSKGLRPRASREFSCFERRLNAGEPYVSRVIGQTLLPGRGKHLDRFLRRLLKHRVGPAPVVLGFAKEIVETASSRTSVGTKVLALSVPRLAARRAYEMGEYTMLATQPNLADLAFCYFDPEYSGLRQYGPTVVCGESAMTDIETEDDPVRAYQSSSMRILHTPKGTA
jgi:hypothetical protein